MLAKRPSASSETRTSTRDLERLILTVQLYSIAATAIITGVLEMALGVRSQNLFGAGIAEELLVNGFLDSQFRFVATIWFGVGLLILMLARDMKKYVGPIRVILFLVLLGGLTRFLAMAQTGLPPEGVGQTYLLSVWSVELLGGPLALLLLHRVSRRGAL